MFQPYTDFLKRAGPVRTILPSAAFLFTSLLIPFSFCLVTPARTHISPSINAFQQHENPAVNLGVGQTVSRSLSAGETQVYKVALTEGQYARVLIEQLGIDVSARLAAPDGKLIADINGARTSQGSENIELVAKIAGDFKIEITSGLPKAEPGKYSIQLNDIHNASADEKLLNEARELYFESIRLNDLGKTDKALELASRSLEIRQKFSDSNKADVAASLRSLGVIYLGRRDRTHAEENFQRAEIATKVSSGGDSLEYADVLQGLADVAFAKGENEQSEKLNLRALSIREKLAGENSVQVSTSFSSLGLLYRGLSDLPKSESYFLRAVAIRERWLGPDHLDLAPVLNNLGMLYYGAGNYDAAEPILQRALAIREKVWGTNHKQVGAILGNLGLVEWKRGNFEKSEAYHRRALAIYEKTGDNYGLASSLHNLAILYKEVGKDYKKAEEYYQRALAIWLKLVGENDSATANVYTSLGLLYEVTGDLAKAEEFHLKAQAIYERVLGPNNYYTLLSLRSLAEVYAMRSNFERSADYQRRVNALEERLIGTNLTIGSERQKLMYFHQLEGSDKPISIHVKLAPDNASLRDLAVTKLLQRKGRVLDALAENLVALRQRSSVEDQSLLDRLNVINSKVASLLLRGPGKAAPDEYQDQVKSLESEREKLEIEISHHSAGFYEVSRPVTLDAVKAAIPDDAALIEFAAYRPANLRATNSAERYGEPRYVAYVIRRQGDVRWVELGAAKDIEALVTTFRKALRDPGSRDVQKVARLADQQIMRPVRELAPGVKHLLISPDGELNLIPFEAFVNENGHYLIEDYSFSYLSSGRDLLRLQVKRESKSAPVVFANPAFGNPAVLNAKAGRTSTSEDVKATQFNYSHVFFGPLPGVGAEVRALKDLLPNATFFTGEEATEAKLKQVRAPSILHIATHGFFLQTPEETGVKPKTSNEAGLLKAMAQVDNPLVRSGLALAGANQGHSGDEDGVLTALEASALDLWGTKLVVLSACDTGIGEVKNGDGVYGLRRALFLAGTESQLMSLWPVSDISTHDLMAGYYKELLHDTGRGEALRRVQLQMLHSKTRRHPYYWASFILAGEWANLKGQR